jgi:hypothetical protein
VKTGRIIGFFRGIQLAMAGGSGIAAIWEACGSQSARVREGWVG